jgi:hypothetical protein
VIAQQKLINLEHEETKTLKAMTVKLAQAKERFPFEGRPVSSFCVPLQYFIT